MLVSFNWLKQFVDLPDSVSAEELGYRLTMSTVEVDEVRKIDKNLTGIIVGQIKKMEKHSDADNLWICHVSDGNTLIQVVCGGSNLKKGMKVAFAPPGCSVRWHGEGELVELKKVKIRGEESFGMICQSTEIGLGEMFPISDEAEIMNLDHLDVKVGTPLSTALILDDVVFDIDNKSMTHRPDLWGHYGLAREVAALYNKKLVAYIPPIIKEGKKKKIKVEIEDTKLCPRYMAVAVDGIKIEDSPQWLKKKLHAVGLRSINNIVDITNYVMFEVGQPMHAFDSNNLSSDLIKVRRAENSEIFTTLDDDEHEMDNRDLVIADNEKAIALAGIMGGKNSEILNNTTSVIFESANFNAVNIRRSALRLGIRSDSSSRFEKSLDPNNCELAIRRAVQLVLEICPGSVVSSNVADSSDFSLTTGPIELLWDFLNKKIGVELPKKEVIKILQSLGFVIKEKKEGLAVTIPSWRATKDISISEDLVEEISRIYGYDNIEGISPSFPITPPPVNTLRSLEGKALEVFIQNLNYTESYNYSFVSEKQITNFGDDITQYIELDNPISKEKPFLRRNLLLNLLENISKNIEFFDNVKLVEIGKTFKTEDVGQRMDKKGDEMLPRQDVYLTAVYASKKDSNPFETTRSALESICHKLNTSFQLVSDVSKRHEHPNRSAHVFINECKVGNIFELHPQTAMNYGLEVRVGVVEINLNKLNELIGVSCVKYEKISEYPPMHRDLAIVIKDNINYIDILEKIQSIDPILQKVELFDIYQGKNIGEGYKSMAFHLTYGSYEKTLETNIVDKIQDKIIKVLEKEFDASVRQ